MEARMVLVPVAKDGVDQGWWRPSLAELEMVLREHGVKAPLDQVSVQAALDRVSQGLRVEVVAARGLPPEPGKDGRLELLVDLSGPVPPATAEGGAVDLKTSSLIRNVTTGQPLAVVHPPSVGRAGLDVRGMPLPPAPGRPWEEKFGPNVKRAAHDPSLLISATDGHVLLRDGRLEVEECFLVGGDVDYASGNVAFAKSVLVHGDVKSGFSVEASGDVEVRGLVEDCALKAQGKVFIRGGFTGSGKGRVEAGGEVAVAHVRNQAVRAEGDILVAKEAVNSRLQSRGQVMVKGLLAGGRVQALRAIVCETAGTEKGTPTVLEAGFDFLVAEEMTDIHEVLGDLGRYARKLEVGIQQLQDLEKLNRSLDRWSIELVFETERMRSLVEAKIASLRERFSELENKGGDGRDASILVLRKAYPGTVIRIGQDILRVEEPLEGPRIFRRRGGIIEMRSEGPAHAGDST